MVATKARVGIKQYMKANPIKWGPKLFVLANMTGYTVDYIFYNPPHLAQGRAFPLM